MLQRAYLTLQKGGSFIMLTDKHIKHVKIVGLFFAIMLFLFFVAFCIVLASA